MSGSNFSTDSIRFYDACLPPIPAGDYRISVSLDVKGSAIEKYLKSNTKTQNFIVSGPRFKLNKTDIHSCFPPSHSMGKFHKYLPHVVLNKRSLPWERELKTADTTIPWMALLLLKKDEIFKPGAFSSKTSPTLSGTYTVDEVINPEDGTLGPRILPDDHDNLTRGCEAIDLSPEVFKKITPRLDELKFLAHSRRVNTGNKEVIGLKARGWFSVVVGNRLPDNDSGQYVVHLVSLEGFEQYLTGNPNWEGKTIVRLFSLTSWAFTNEPEKEVHFTTPKTSDLLKLPDSEINDQGQGFAQAVAALRNGYVPFGYINTQDDRTFAWYRSPLSPIKTARFTDQLQLGSASQAMVYDETTGLFNMTYAIAWQTGRLSALSDSVFSRNLLEWRRKGHRLVDILLSRMDSDLISEETKKQLTVLIEDKLLSNDFLNYLVDDLADEISSKQVKSKRASTSSVPSGQMIDQLRCLMKNQAVQDLLTNMGGHVFTVICEWLANLSLLYKVPFNNLVPDARMLPENSIRFFYIDQNALDALIEGALSIGIQSSRDIHYQQIFKDTIRNTTKKLILKEREKLLGSNSTINADVTGTMSGFLLRSTIVSNFPGLEVKAFANITTGEPKDPINLLRMDRLFPDVLLCIFPSTPAWIQITEPSEGLGLGVEDEELNIYLRYISGDKTGQHLDGDPAPRISLSKRNDSPVLDISNLLEQLEKQKLGNNGQISDVGPGGLALQLIKAPLGFIYRLKKG